jgi:hypothetical protein
VYPVKERRREGVREGVVLVSLLHYTYHATLSSPMLVHASLRTSEGCEVGSKPGSVHVTAPYHQYIYTLHRDKYPGPGECMYTLSLTC